MLAKFEGKTIDFSIQMSDGTVKLVQGRIIRAGYVPQFDLLERYGQQYLLPDDTGSTAAGAADRG